jgi:hypothetical protein
MHDGVTADTCRMSDLEQSDPMDHHDMHISPSGAAPSVPRGRPRGVLALVAALALALPGSALAANEIGTLATVAAPASHALLARAGKLVLADVKRAVAAQLAAGGDYSATYSKAVCRGTTKRIVCVATSIQNMAPVWTETVLVRHGKLTGQGSIAGVGVASAASVHAHVIAPGDINLADSENRLAMAYCVAADVTSELLATVNPYGRITAQAVHNFSPSIPVGVAGLLAATESVSNGVYFTFSATCASATGDVFRLAVVQAEVGAGMVTESTTGTWAGPRNTHGTWRKAGPDKYSITTK